ncbi:MAG: hypothetical protein ACT4OT_14825 [Acidobacteriota bacterium]
MKRTTAIMAIVLTVTILTSTVSPVVFAQQPAGDWTAVQSVAPGDEVSAKLKDGKKVGGRFSSANDSELVILRKNKQQPIARNTIAQVYRLERRAEKAKYAAIGAGIGAGAGAVIGGVKANSTSDDGYVYTIVGVIFGTGFGALGGLLFGQGKRKHVLIYEAP